MIGRIYKIYSPSRLQLGCYIGSTVHSLSRRYSIHKCTHRSFLNGKQAWSSVFKILGASNDAKIEQIEEVECDNIGILRKREGHFIQSSPDCVNRNVAGRSSKERYLDNPELYRTRSNQYYALNREKRKVYYMQPEVRARYIARSKASYWAKKESPKAVSDLCSISV